MASVNKVILVGNCGRDTELRHTSGGKPVASTSIATSSRWKDRETGEAQEATQWHRVTFYDRLAEVAAEHLVKGKQVYLEGRLQYGQYTDKDGVERNTAEVVVTELVLLGSKSPAASSAAPAAKSGRKAGESGPADDDADIPF